MPYVKTGMKSGPEPRPLIERFMGMVAPEPNSGCWLWTGPDNGTGYGVMTVGSRSDGTNGSKTAHRISYELFCGEIPSDLIVMHKCDVRCCVNPDHLTLGTKHDNTSDMLRKGRGARQKQKACLHGHPFTPENTSLRKIYGRKSFARICLTCERQRSKEKYQRLKPAQPMTEAV